MIIFEPFLTAPKLNMQNFRSVAQKLWLLSSGHTYTIHIPYIHTEGWNRRNQGENQSTLRSSVLLSIQYSLVISTGLWRVQVSGKVPVSPSAFQFLFTFNDHLTFIAADEIAKHPLYEKLHSVSVEVIFSSYNRNACLIQVYWRDQVNIFFHQCTMA